MAENSRFWDGHTVGDATDAPYSDLEWADTVRWKFTQGEGDQGVIRGIGSNLVLDAGAGSHLHIKSGAALVNGRLYYNDDDSPELAISGASKWWVVGLFSDESAHTIRAFVRGPYNTEALALASIVQTPGGDWEIVLYTVMTGAGGLYNSSEDYRIYAMREYQQVFIPAICGLNVTDGTGIDREYRGVPLPDAHKSRAYGHFYVPRNYEVYFQLETIVIPLATGDSYCSSTIDYEKLGEGLYNVHTNTSAYAVDSMTANVVCKTSNADFGTAGYTDAEEGGGDFICVFVERDATDPLDTVADTIYVAGWRATFYPLY